MIDTGVDDVPDLKGKIDSIWTVSGTTVSQAPPEGNDEYGHGTAVASLIAANVDDQFGMAGFGGATHVIAVRAGIRNASFDDTLHRDRPDEARLSRRADRQHESRRPGTRRSRSSSTRSTRRRRTAFSSWPLPATTPSTTTATSAGRRRICSRRTAGAATASPSARPRRRPSRLLLGLGEAPLARCAGDLRRQCPRSARRASDVRARTTSSAPDLGRRGRSSLRQPRRHVVLLARGVGHRRPDLGGAARADELPGRRHHQAVRGTAAGRAGRRRWAAASSTQARRSSWRRVAPLPSGQSRPGDVVCSTGGVGLATWPTERTQTITFDPIEAKTIGDADFAVPAQAPRPACRCRSRRPATAPSRGITCT